MDLPIVVNGFTYDSQSHRFTYNSRSHGLTYSSQWILPIVACSNTIISRSGMFI